MWQYADEPDMTIMDEREDDRLRPSTVPDASESMVTKISGHLSLIG